MPFNIIFTLFCLLALSVLHPSTAQAQTIIRDSEIEQTLRGWAAPIFTAAGLQPDNVNIILVQDSGVNAFVAGGANIFLFTGLLNKAENPEEIIGVIAHETGHISGGHLIRLRTSVEQASFETIIGTILGIGAAVISGNGNAAGAIISGTQSLATSRFLANSRLNESSADQAGVSFMNKAGIDPKGLETFLKKLAGDELLPTDQQAEYVRTHPLTTNRIEAVQTKVADSPMAGHKSPAAWNEDFARIKAKLAGFITPQQVEWQYPASDTSVAATYARAIADYRLNKISDALAQTNILLKKEPKNPYFQELMGQMLVEFGRVDEGLPYYKRAVAGKPEAGLIRLAYAQALIDHANRTNNHAEYKQAIQELETARRYEKKSPRLYRLLATAHGRLDDEVQARLNLAEEAVLQNRLGDARHMAEYVLQNTKDNNRAHIRARDIINFINQNNEK